LRSLAEEEHIVATVSYSAISGQVGLFGEKTAIQKPPLAASHLVELELQRTVDFVIKTRHRGEQHGLQQSAIFHKLQRVSLVETNLEALVNGEGEKCLFERVRVGKV